MDAAEAIVPIALFLVVGTCVGLFFYFRFRTRQELQQTVRAAIDSGQSLSADVLAEITSALHPKGNDLRKGIIFVALALAFFTFGMILDDPQGTQALSGIASFPLFIGLAYLLIWRTGRTQG